VTAGTVRLRRQATTLALALLVAGCASRVREPAAPEPFVFRSLDLRQQTRTGQPAWALTAPEARYDLNRQLAQARRPKGIVYRSGKPYLNLDAQRATVLGDGQAILLEGDVRIVLLGANPVRIYGDQARWIPRQNLMVIDRRPYATDRRARIRARSARYRVDLDLVELRGEPMLEQWQQNQPAAGQRAPAPIRVHARSINWRPDQGDLSTANPVRGERFEPVPAARANAAQTPELVLTASGLKGNLRRGMIDLLAPVRIRNRSGDTWLNALQTRWAINDQWLASDLPFNGAVKALRARGDAVRINLVDETVLVPRGCVLNQPGEQLTATTCLWHWPSGRFNAAGDVVLRRDLYKQITRSAYLEGRLGATGEALFTTPGARVGSEFTLPPSGSNRSRSQRSGPPVRF